MSQKHFWATGLVAVLAAALLGSALSGQKGPASAAQAGRDLDRTVQAFLDANAGRWRDMNVSERDGRILHDLILQHKFTRALEIGTSTGHSGIWIAWALSKTGGRLITIDIDEGRHREAVAHFKAAGLEAYVDARLADAHDLVPALPGPFDFVFCDADKDWYKNYFVAVWPKVTAGGVFTAHNVSPRMRRGGWGAGSFVDHVLSLPDAETSFAEGSWAGLSISYKRIKQVLPLLVFPEDQEPDHGDAGQTHDLPEGRQLP